MKTGSVIATWQAPAPAGQGGRRGQARGWNQWSVGVREALLGFGIGALVSVGLYMRLTAHMTPPQLTRVAIPETAGGGVDIDLALGGEPGVLADERAPPGLPPARLDAVAQMLDADLGDEGIPVDRQQIDTALRDDPTLADAILE